jgi:hypothetical protein
MKRMLALAGVLLTMLGASAANGKVRDFYALRYGANMNLLVPYDPVRLAPSGTAIRLGRFAHAWSISPDRSQFVSAAGVRRKGEPTALRFVDLTSGRSEGTVTLPDELRRVTATAWVRGRVLAVVSGSDSTTVYGIDPQRRVTIGQIQFSGIVVLGERALHRLVLLLAPADRIGPATVAVVDQGLRVRTVVLDRISAGTNAAGEGADRRLTVRRPALALAPSGLRVFVLGAGEPAAAIDLRTLAVRYAPLRTTTAASKQIEGSVRTAAALPDGRVVLGGFDYGATSAGKSVGLSLVDPKDWSRRVLDPAASWFHVAGGLVFTRGKGGVGLRILRPSGSRVDLFRTGSVASVTVVGPRALVTFFGTNQTAVIELGSGRITRRTVPAHPLVGTGQPIVG